jgi:hypothetical protein
MAEMSTSTRLQSAVDQILEQAMSREEIAALVRALGEKIGLADFAFDADGLATIAAEDLVLLASCQQGFPGFTAAALLPNERRARPIVYRRLLQANLSWDETGGGAFFLLPGDDTLALASRISLADRDLDRAARDLTNLVELGRHWTTEIELVSDLVDAAPESDEAAAEPVPGGPSMIRA